MTRSEACNTTPITIQLTGFPSVDQAREFLMAIVKPELQAHFSQVSMRREGGAVLIEQTICCNADGTEFATCSNDPISEICTPVGSGCPTVTKGA